MKFIIVKFVVFGSIIISDTEAINFGAIANSLLSHGLQPSSTLSAGRGGYLQDDFRTTQLIPTFRRIKNTFLELDHSVQIVWVFMILILLVEIMGFVIQGLYIYALRAKIQCLEASRTWLNQDLNVKTETVSERKKTQISDQLKDFSF